MSIQVGQFTSQSTVGLLGYIPGKPMVIYNGQCYQGGVVVSCDEETTDWTTSTGPTGPPVYNIPQPAPTPYVNPHPIIDVLPGDSPRPINKIRVTKPPIRVGETGHFHRRPERSTAEICPTWGYYSVQGDGQYTVHPCTPGLPIDRGIYAVPSRMTDARYPKAARYRKGVPADDRSRRGRFAYDSDRRHGHFDRRTQVVHVQGQLQTITPTTSTSGASAVSSSSKTPSTGLLSFLGLGSVSPMLLLVGGGVALYLFTRRR